MKRKSTSCLLLVLAVCAAVVTRTPAARGPRVEGGVVEFSLPDLEGAVVSSKDARLSGKVLLIDIWGTWCPPCITEIPTFVDLQARYGREGFMVIAIAFEKEEDPEARRRRLVEFRDKHEINYLILDGGNVEEFASSLPSIKGVTGLPIEILVARDGNVAVTRNGYGYSKRWARKLETELKDLLGAGVEPALKIVELYRAAANDHDIELALSYLSPDFKLRFVGTQFELSKQELREAMGWDAGANGHIEWELVSSDESGVTFLGSETNDFLSLVGISELKFRTTFTLDPEGRIETQLYEQLPGQGSPDEAMKPAVEWASRHRPEVLRDIYPDGRMVYTEEMARDWVALLREWKAAESHAER